MIDAPCRTDGRFPADPNLRMPAMLDRLAGVAAPDGQVERAPLGWPAGSIPWTTYADATIVLTMAMGGEGRRHDMSEWPPRSSPTASHYQESAALPDGRLARHDAGATRCVAWFDRGDLSKPVRAVQPFVDGQPFPTDGIARCSERLLLWPKQGKRWRRRPALETGEGAFELLAELPAPRKHSARGVATLGDGGSVVLWDEQGYERVEGRWQPTFAIDGATTHP